MWILFSVLCCLLFSSAMASDISLHGFFEGNYAFNTETSNPDSGDFKWAEERLQLKLDASRKAFRLFLKTDVSYDHIGEKEEVELREAYIDFTADSWDLRIGRQVLTWGLGDLVFINDTYPKDYEAFFSGRPMEYLKKGIDGAKIGMYPSFASLELVIIPFFEPNVYPASNRFHMYDPMPTVTHRREEEPANSINNTDNTEVALRVYRDIAEFDTSVYFYRGFFRQPSMLPDNMSSPTRIDLFYPELSVYGASFQGRVLDGVVSLEGGYYDSRQDRDGTEPMIPNQSARFLVGYQRQAWEDFTVGLQYYCEYMNDYSKYVENLPAGFPQEKKLYDLVAMRLTQFLKHQTLRLSFFSFYSPANGDYLLNPEVKYNFSDHVWAAAGANIFGGGQNWSQFGSLDENDNLYVQVRYEF